MRAFALAALLIAAAGSRFAFSQDSASAWAALSESQKQAVRENYRRYQAMPAADKAAVDAKYERFQKLAPKQRERVVAGYRKFHALPAGEQRKALDRVQQRKESRAATHQSRRTEKPRSERREKHAASASDRAQSRREMHAERRERHDERRERKR